MTEQTARRFQLIVFALVSAAFTNIYITQPVLPVLQREFGADMVRVSFTVSAVVLGIALSNLPFGALADRLPIRPIILAGGFMVALAGLVCAAATSLWVLTGARFVQGLFIPAMTTCLAGPPFQFSTQRITLLYLVDIVGIFMGPTAGRISNRLGSGTTLIAGSAVLAVSLAVILIPATAAVVAGLLGSCTGFLAVHAAAVGALNRKLAGGQGRANALYVLFYYLGGWFGITAAGFTYRHAGWPAVALVGAGALSFPLSAGIALRRERRQRRATARPRGA